MDPAPCEIAPFNLLCPNEQAAHDLLVQARWPDGFRCPGCDCRHATTLPRRRLWQCIGCGLQTSVTSRTVLHATKLPLRTWIYALWAMSRDDDSTSAASLQRTAGIGAYRSAWALLQKVRRALTGTATIDLPPEGVEVAVERVGADALCKASATTAPHENLWIVAAVAGPGPLHEGPHPAAARVGRDAARHSSEWAESAFRPARPLDGVVVRRGHRAERLVLRLVGQLLRTFRGVSRRYAWAYVQAFVDATRHGCGPKHQESLVRQVMSGPWVAARQLGERPAGT